MASPLPLNVEVGVNDARESNSPGVFCCDSSRDNLEERPRDRWRENQLERPT